MPKIVNKREFEGTVPLEDALKILEFIKKKINEGVLKKAEYKSFGNLGGIMEFIQKEEENIKNEIKGLQNNVEIKEEENMIIVSISDSMSFSDGIEVGEPYKAPPEFGSIKLYKNWREGFLKTPFKKEPATLNFSDKGVSKEIIIYKDISKRNCEAGKILYVMYRCPTFEASEEVVYRFIGYSDQKMHNLKISRKGEMVEKAIREKIKEVEKKNNIKLNWVFIYNKERRAFRLTTKSHFEELKKRGIE